MSRRSFITTLLTAFTLTVMVFLYTLHFRYCSGSYTLMKLRLSMSENNVTAVEKLCNLKSFSDSFMLMLPLIESQQFVPTDSVFTNRLIRLHAENRPLDFIYAVSGLLLQTGGSMVNQHEKTSGKGKILTQYYKLKGRDYSIGISFYFERNESELQLQCIEKLFVTPI
ncbi:MAG: hypothetical protein BWY70_00295 [Bacteroidetes bacterium ADurb.Bin408]|nr:MAG: hypothetical protein BWY70_00295 [Bacteroidetes bacterium ADurb.Bin408]